MVSYPGQITGDLVVSGDLTVDGAGGYAYTELTDEQDFTLAAQTASDLTAAVAANATYLLHAAVILTNATGSSTVSWTGPTGATMQWNDTTTSTDYADTIDGTNSYASSASTRMALFLGLLKTSDTAGDLTMTMGVSAGTTAVAAGSFLRLDRVA